MAPYHLSRCFMDYLHGDVKRDEAELACAYEFARESKELREAAKRRDEILRNRPNLDCERIVLSIVGEDARRGQSHPIWEWRFLMCRGFPTRDWNELSNPERAKILEYYETRQVPPLPMPDLLWMPKAVAMLGGFNKLAIANTPPIPQVQPGDKIPPMKPVPAMLQKAGSVYWCLFAVDFSESESRVSDRFLKWLNQNGRSNFFSVN
jgi:hypothetical protein